MYYKNIEEALKAERPNDYIVKILSNKFAIVQGIYEKGMFANYVSVCSLEQDKILFFPHYLFGVTQRSIRSCEIDIESLPNIEKRMICYYTNPKYQVGARWELKTIDHRRYKRIMRKLNLMLREYLRPSEYKID